MDRVFKSESFLILGPVRTSVSDSSGRNFGLLELSYPIDFKLLKQLCIAVLWSLTKSECMYSKHGNFSHNFHRILSNYRNS